MAGTNAVSTDVVAMLSGVNFGSVVKVFAAIEAVRIHLGAAPEDIVRFGDIPLESVHSAEDPHNRYEATELIVNEMARSREIDFLDYVLRHKRRIATEQEAG